MKDIYGNMFKAGFLTKDWYKNLNIISPFLQEIIKNDGFLDKNKSDHIYWYANNITRFEYLLKANVPYNTTINNQSILLHVFKNKFEVIKLNQVPDQQVVQRIFSLLENNPQLQQDFFNLDELSGSKSIISIFQIIKSCQENSTFKKLISVIPENKISPILIKNIFETLSSSIYKNNEVDFIKIMLDVLNKKGVLTSKMLLDVLNVPNVIYPNKNLNIEIIKSFKMHNLFTANDEKILVKQGFKSVFQTIYDLEFNNSFGADYTQYLEDFCTTIKNTINELQKLKFLMPENIADIKDILIDTCIFLKSASNNTNNNQKLHYEHIEKNFLFLSLIRSNGIVHAKNKKIIL